MQPILGGIADDITGGTDLDLMLGRNGMAVVQFIGCPQARAPWPQEAAAVVLALKSRTAPRSKAVAETNGLVTIEKRPGPAAVRAGSCSVAAREQVAHMTAICPALRVDSLRLADGRQRSADIVAWAVE